ncbi:DUF123 domain-containing protein [Halobacteriales archaeon QH_8_64_26]|nr:MAG: DUF123 domain-containing protein [Halobacteriales archaeon QH_8_64_26]
MTETRAKGTYTLLIELEANAEIGVGALGLRDFPAGWYAYTGSAFGTGGFSRVDRHRRVAAGDHDVRHWHIDYLLGHPAVRLDAVRTSAGLDAECRVARALPGERVAGFGASDCGCDSHLAYATERTILSRAIGNAYAEQ